MPNSYIVNRYLSTEICRKIVILYYIGIFRTENKGKPQIPAAKTGFVGPRGNRGVGADLSQAGSQTVKLANQNRVVRL